MTTNIHNITRLEQIDNLSEDECSELAPVTDKFAFECNDYYLSLINWDDPDGPIRRVVIPHIDELEQWGHLDPSCEEKYTVMPGVEHKYNSTALLLISNVCAGICRYCFRKRVFIKSRRECLEDVDRMLEYIGSHREITNVLLTGGDPLLKSTEYLEKIIGQLRNFDHVGIIRIGTKIPVFNPYRIIDDPSLLEMIEKYSRPEKKIYIITHFSHPREFTDVAIEGITLLQKAGAILTNQCPLIRGVNDDPQVLAQLIDKASFAGVAPYYIFQCRPALGNRAYTVPIEQAYTIVEQAKAQVSGLAKRCKYVMSHSTGKIEIVGKTHEHVFFKYHRAADDADSGRFMVYKTNPQACWLDDYTELVEDCRIDAADGVPNIT
jgi:lysine 2,3-aminomutase